ncbi:hypothetical protein GUJ93_ZPchr0003g17247 [Zizania palustris]|uniref:Uncharacterized protein n=1 Tax=Zizania palustris TaxID=103762 RepID=A0A8J5VEI2_ZIZPA|nr:hypothetical protein GUJ93_ZPchr0003g17247 [Zizania palustris]
MVPHRPPPPAPLSPVQAALPTPAAADVVVGRPQLLPYACTRVVGGWHGCWKEGVAESWCPTTEEPAAEEASVGDLSDDSVGCGYDDDDDDGCGSCVDGGEGTVAWRERDDKLGSSSVSSLPWWSQVDGGGGGGVGVSFLWPPPSASRAADHRDHRAGGERHDDVDDDPKATAARRQEEDRKFWEECLATGYP